MAKEKKEIEIFDSEREVSMEEIIDHCEANECEVPEEGSTAYWDIVGDFHQWECEDFRDDSLWRFKLGKCLVKGYAGLWTGPAAGGKFIEVNRGGDLFFMDVDRVRVVIDPEDGLVVYGYHHDGTNRYVIYQVTERGEKYIARHEDEYSPRELHERMLKAHLVKKVTLKDIQPE